LTVEIELTERELERALKYKRDTGRSWDQAEKHVTGKTPVRYAKLPLPGVKSSEPEDSSAFDEVMDELRRHPGGTFEERR
jgi:hypothetical protein